MDWQHLIMNGENLAEYAALLAAEGLLGHQHANSGWGTFDDDNMVGATAFMETIELAIELRRAGLRRRTASGSASTSTRTPRTRSPRCAARCCSGASSTRSPRGSTTRRCARRRRRRTRSAPTSSSTPPSGRDGAPTGRLRVRLQHVSIPIPLDGAERARAFYGGLLGLEERDVLPKLDPARFIWYRVGGDLELHLMLLDEPPPQQPALLPRRRRPRRAAARASRPPASRRATAPSSSAGRASPAATRSATWSSWRRSTP